VLYLYCSIYAYIIGSPSQLRSTDGQSRRNDRGEDRDHRTRDLDEDGHGGHIWWTIGQYRWTQVQLGTTGISFDL
jgi:hypothetical protein